MSRVFTAVLVLCIFSCWGTVVFGDSYTVPDNGFEATGNWSGTYPNWTPDGTTAAYEGSKVALVLGGSSTAYVDQVLTPTFQPNTSYVLSAYFADTGRSGATFGGSWMRIIANGATRDIIAVSSSMTAPATTWEKRELIFQTGDELTTVPTVRNENGVPDGGNTDITGNVLEILVGKPIGAVAAEQTYVDWVELKYYPHPYTWTVGTGGDFATLEEANASPLVWDGDTLSIQEDLVVSGGEITIAKSLTINGNGNQITTRLNLGTITMAMNHVNLLVPASAQGIVTSSAGAGFTTLTLNACTVDAATNNAYTAIYLNNGVSGVKFEAIDSTILGGQWDGISGYASKVGFHPQPSMHY